MNARIRINRGMTPIQVKSVVENGREPRRRHGNPRLFKNLSLGTTGGTLAWFNASTRQRPLSQPTPHKQRGIALPHKTTSTRSHSTVTLARAGWRRIAAPHHQCAKHQDTKPHTPNPPHHYRPRCVAHQAAHHWDALAMLPPNALQQIPLAARTPLPPGTARQRPYAAYSPTSY